MLPAEKQASFVELKAEASNSSEMKHDPHTKYFSVSDEAFYINSPAIKNFSQEKLFVPWTICLGRFAIF